MRGVSIVWCLAVALLGAVPVAAAVPLGGTSFEVGQSGFGLRGAVVEGPGEHPVLERSGAAEGRVALRWPLRRGPSPAAVEWPARAYPAGQTISFSAMMRADREGQAARLVVLAPDGEPLAQASYLLSADWRRYELLWTPAVGAERAWLQILPEPAEQAGSWWVDDMRLSLAEGEPAEVEPELGVSLRGAPLRWAGQSAQFVVRLRSPRGLPEVAWNWRLETAAGAVWKRFAGLLTLAAGVGQTTLTMGALPPGAYRLVAEALCEGRTLTAGDSLVVIEPQLGELPRWGGIEGVAAAAAVDDLVLLRLGRLRGAADSAIGPEVPSARAKLLVGARHEGIETMGYWPADEAALAPWSRLVTWWEPPAGELWNSVADDGERLRARRAALRGRARLCGVRLAAAAGPLAKLGELAEEGLLALTDAIQIQAASGAPEPLGDLPWAELRARCGGRPLWVVLAGQPAVPWNVDDGSHPLCQPALRQAAWLARGVLLARYAGADGAWYPGAPAGLPPDRLTMASRCRSVDLCDEQGRPQPATAALCWALDALRGRRAARAVGSPPGVRLQLWEGRRALLTAWCTEPGGRAELRLPLRGDQVEVRDVGGTPVATGQGQVRLSLGEAPIYIEPRSGALTRFAAAAEQCEVAPVAP